METVANVFWFFVMIALVAYVAPALFEVVCFMVVVAAQVVLAVIVFSFIIAAIENLFVEKDEDGQKTWSF